MENFISCQEIGDPMAQGEMSIIRRIMIMGFLCFYSKSIKGKFKEECKHEHESALSE